MPKTVKLRRARRRKNVAERGDWKVQQLPNGSMGCACPVEECGGKVVVNPDQLASSRKRLGVGYMICPYCELMSTLPKEAR